jgi:S1-C subfamily serine protease
MSTEWTAISNALANTADRAAGLAVAVHTGARGSTSGLIWRPGLIVATEHTLRREEEIPVTLPDGQVANAKVAGRDASTDIALLKCQAAAAPAATIAHHGESLKAGQLTLVVGRTRASGPVAALGLVSLVAGERRLWGGAAISPYVRLDVALPGIAIGGAVVDANGEIIGIATPKFAPAGALALTASTLNRVVDALLSKGHIPRGYLGVGMQPVRLPDNLRSSLQRQEKTAAVVLEVEPNGPADQAGVVIGDILMGMNGKAVMRLEDVQAHLHGEQIGKTIRAEFLRGGVNREVEIVVAERPNRSE